MVLGLLGRGAVVAAKAAAKALKKKKPMATKKVKKFTPERHTAQEARKMADSGEAIKKKNTDYIFQKDIKDRAQKLRDAKAPSKDQGPSRKDRAMKGPKKPQAESNASIKKKQNIKKAAIATGGAAALSADMKYKASRMKKKDK